MAYGVYAYNSLSNYVIFKMEKYIVLSTLIDELVQCGCHKRHKYEIITRKKQSDVKVHFFRRILCIIRVL